MAKHGKLELTWVGKDERVRLEPRVLVEDSTKSYGAPDAENMLIFGDNLLALKALEQDFTGKIKCVFIDPPYNIGSASVQHQYEDGLEHSTWLSMMRDRLCLLWRLLADVGSIWITIDDNEAHYLKVLCDELFGRNCFVSDIAWQKRTSRENRAAIGSAHDHILVYAKYGDVAWKNVRNRLQSNNSGFSNPDNDPKGEWRSIPFSAQGYRPNQMYEISTPAGTKVLPPKGRCWGATEPVFKELLAEKRVYFPKKGAGKPRIKQYMGEEDGLVPMSWWPSSEAGDNESAKKEILELFTDVEAFSTPKPEKLLHNIIAIATNRGDWVLDSFAGSGTTGAVAHKMGRKWIMCELGEHCHTHIIPRMKKVIDGEDQGGISTTGKSSAIVTLCKECQESLCAECTDKIGENDKGGTQVWFGGGGFKYYRLAESLLVTDKELSTDDHPVYVINPRYDEKMLIRAICKIENFRYRNEGRLHGISSERRFLHVTTRLVTQEYLNALADDLAPDQSLMVYCTRRSRKLRVPDSIEIKRIPRDLLEKCDFEEEKK